MTFFYIFSANKHQACAQTYDGRQRKRYPLVLMEPEAYDLVNRGHTSNHGNRHGNHGDDSHRNDHLQDLRSDSGRTHSSANHGALVSSSHPGHARAPPVHAT